MKFVRPKIIGTLKIQKMMAGNLAVMNRLNTVKKLYSELKMQNSEMCCICNYWLDLRTLTPKSKRALHQ